MRRKHLSILNSPSSILASTGYTRLANSPPVGQSGFQHNGQTVMTTTKTDDLLNRLTGIASTGSAGVSPASAFNNQCNQANQRTLAMNANNSASALWTNIIVSGGQSVTGNVYVAQQPEAFRYDADGNLTNDGRWAYVWDAENRLARMTVNTNVGPQYQLSFAYDAKSRRIQKVVATNGVAVSTNKFLYDGWNLIAETRPNNSLIRSYVWGTDLSGTSQGAGGVGGLLEISYYGSSTTNCFPAYDGNGNVMALVNAADGTLAANYDYAAFGEPIRITGAMARNNPFRFSTKYADDESDLLYYGYRYYKPSTGTWPGKDPINERGFRTQVRDGTRYSLREEKNLYDILGNNVPNLYDKDGRAAGYIIAGVAVAAYACAKPQYDAAFQKFPDSSDKFKHCWVSCRISKTCGGLISELDGFGKEARDRAVAAYCDTHPDADICQGGHGDFWDSIGDLRANQKCIGWESIVAGPVGGWIGAACRQSCEDCCKAKVGYNGQIDGKTGSVTN